MQIVILIVLAILVSRIISEFLLELFSNNNSKPILYGGLAVYIATWLVFFGSRPHLLRSGFYLEIFLASTIVLITGIIDDKYELKPWQKSIGILLAANIIYFRTDIVFLTELLPDVSGELNQLVTYLLTIAWIYLGTNALNLLDGVDGLATSVSMTSIIMLIAASFLYTRTPSANFISLLVVLVGGLLGFLPFNKSPAKIYLGDTGSLWLGFMYSCLSVTNLKNISVFSLFLPILFYLVPLYDAIYAVIRRLIKGLPVTQKDQNHIHHQLLRHGFNANQVVGIMVSVTLVCGIVGIVSYHYGEWRWLMVIIGGLVVVQLAKLIDVE